MKFSIIPAIILLVSISFVSAEALHDDNESRGSDDPRIIVTDNDVFVVWNESHHSKFSDVYFAKIADGKKLHTPINITDGTSFYPSPEIYAYKNNIYLLWEDRNSEDGFDQIFFARSNDYGETFSKPEKLAGISNNSSIFRPMDLQQVNDVLYVFGSAWNRDTKQNNIIYITSTDFGKTFSGISPIFNHEESDQEIQVRIHDDTIYILSDDRNDFDEKGSLYLRKILPDGTLTDIVNVNDGTTSVTQPQLAISEQNVYVSWRERVFEKGNYGMTERWYQVFTKSNDGGNSFGDIITFDSDPRSIDTVGMEGDFVFAYDNSVHVLWRSEYWDGQTQEFKTFIASSNDLGENFTVKPLSMNEKTISTRIHNNRAG